MLRGLEKIMNYLCLAARVFCVAVFVLAGTNLAFADASDCILSVGVDEQGNIFLGDGFNCPNDRCTPGAGRCEPATFGSGFKGCSCASINGCALAAKKVGNTVTPMCFSTGCANPCPGPSVPSPGPGTVTCPACP